MTFLVNQFVVPYILIVYLIHFGELPMLTTGQFVIEIIALVDIFPIEIF
jgi:hypothetical protein